MKFASDHLIAGLLAVAEVKAGRQDRIKWALRYLAEIAAPAAECQAPHAVNEIKRLIELGKEVASV